MELIGLRLPTLYAACNIPRGSSVGRALGHPMSVYQNNNACWNTPVDCQVEARPRVPTLNVDPATTFRLVDRRTQRRGTCRSRLGA
jgi:hypothetical protein